MQKGFVEISGLAQMAGSSPVFRSKKTVHFNYAE
jgi:hypothetical protein